MKNEADGEYRETEMKGPTGTRGFLNKEKESERGALELDTAG